MPDDDQLLEALLAAIQFARAAERIRASASTLEAFLSTLNDITDLDPDLAPEIADIREHAREAGEGLLRGLRFLDTRYDATMARIKDAA